MNENSYLPTNKLPILYGPIIIILVQEWQSDQAPSSNMYDLNAFTCRGHPSNPIQ